MPHVCKPLAGIGSRHLDKGKGRWHQGSHRPRWSRIPPMKLFLLRIITWWNRFTFETQLWTWRFGELVGTDEMGNKYYRNKGGKIDPTLGVERRWVVYNGYAEATKISPDWHGWMHHTAGVPVRFGRCGFCHSRGV